MQRAEGRRDKEAAKKAERAVGLSLPWDRTGLFLTRQALVLLKRAKFFFFFFFIDLGLINLAVKGRSFFFLYAVRIGTHFSSRMNEFFLHWCLDFCSICLDKYVCMCVSM